MATKGELFVDQLETMLKANITAWIVSHEEERFIHSLRQLVPKFKGYDEPLRILIWSSSEGLIDYSDYLTKSKAGHYGKCKKVMMTQTTLEPFTGKENTKETVVAMFDQFIAYARQENDNTLFVVKDAHHVLDNSKGNHLEQTRKVRDLIHAIRTTTAWLVLLATDDSVPNDLEKEIQVVDMALPDLTEVGELLATALKGFKTLGNKVKINTSTSLCEKIIFNLLGLSEVEICQVLNFTCVKNNGINENALIDIKEMKRQIIEKKGFLEFIAVPETIEIGGHDLFCDYIDTRALYLNKKYREHFNLKAGKGVCMVGPPGAGKSLMARYISARWQLPLIRLDMGAIYGQKLGQSEGRLRDALRIAEANAPVIIWLDEVEKIMGGQNSNDSGTTQRIFGKLLTWMSERTEMVYLYCTANNIDELPPELMRAGRLDSVWWGDLPNQKDCIDIFKIHCKANKINLDEADYFKLGKEAADRQLTGAEIEHTIIESLYRAASTSNLLQIETSVDYEMILDTMKSIRAYAVSRADDLKRNRITALQKFEFTSSHAKQYAEKIALDNKALRLEHLDE